MPKHPAQRAGIPLSSTAASSDYDPRDSAWAAWERHLDAGRIGSRPVMTFENRLRMMKNEVALFGRVVTRALERF